MRRFADRPKALAFARAPTGLAATMGPIPAAHALDYLGKNSTSQNPGDINVNKDILDDPAIRPDTKMLANGYPSVLRDPEVQKVITREWCGSRPGSDGVIRPCPHSV